MHDLRDFLPQPPWKGPPIPEGFVKAFRPSPEQVKLIQEINDKIRKRTTYGTREEPLPGPVSRVWVLSWSNGSACWYIAGHPIWYKYAPEHPEARYGYLYRHPTKAGDLANLDANQVMVMAKRSDIGATLSYLEPLPLYAHSFEARQRGFGTPPPPWTKHWTWPELPAMREVKEKLPRLPTEKVELICAICGVRFEEYRSAEEKLLDAVFGETYCPKHRGGK